MKDRTLACAQARAWVGLNCYDNSFTKIVNIYNRGNAHGYYYDGEGCSETAAACAIVAGGAEFAPMANWAAGQVYQAEQMNIFSKDKFAPGQPIWFRHSNGVDHTGFIVAVSGNTITVFEGNLGDRKECLIKQYAKNTWSIYGTAVVPWTDKLNEKLITSYQEARIKDGAKIKADAVIGTYTKKDLKKFSIESGSTGATVLWLQLFLHELGYYNGLLDGLCGSVTVAAIKAFQKAEGLQIDGVAGYYTIMHIIGE